MTGNRRIDSVLDDCVALLSGFSGRDDHHRFIEKMIASCNHLHPLISDHPDEARLRDRFFRALGFLDRSDLHHRLREKPLGYAGDYQMIDWIYTRHLSRDPLGRAWDRLFHDYPASRAVRNRKRYLDRLLCKLTSNASRPINILSLACGSARELLDSVAAIAGGSLAQNDRIGLLHAVDQETEALELARRLALRNGLPALRLDRANVLRFEPVDEYDLIWCPGLFDYLDAGTASGFIRHMCRFLRPGGQLVIGNFHPSNPMRIPMELATGWWLIHRTEMELIELAISAGIPITNLSAGRESLGIVRFLHVHKGR